MMDVNQKLDRRAFLRRATQLGAIAVAAPTMMSIVGCTKKSNDSGNAGSGNGDSGDGQLGDGEDGVTCSKEETAKLSSDEQGQRSKLEYTDHSPYGKTKDCENCALYNKADSAGSCGTCNLVPGPISPDGHCTSWVQG